MKADMIRCVFSQGVHPVVHLDFLNLHSPGVSTSPKEPCKGEPFDRGLGKMSCLELGVVDFLVISGLFRAWDG